MDFRRRQFLKGSILVATAGFPFVNKLGGAPILSGVAEQEQDIQPSVFEPAEVIAIAAVASEIIPTTDQPGAAEIGIVPYINEAIWGDDEVIARYKKGVADLNGNAQKKFGKLFHKLDSENRVTLLRTIDKTEFFKTLRTHTVEAYYSSTIGLYAVSGYRGGKSHMYCTLNEGFPDVDSKPTP